ncbi:hypothetical protein KKF69_06185, partial [Patescibacteria group bacterium]|nr:hypothetical protein [Patescibacteria group bacterium]
MISIFYILLTAFFYVCITLYLRNYDLASNTLFGEYPFAYKIKIFSGIFVSLIYSLTIFQLTLLIIIALLTGVNVVLLVKRISILRSNGKLKVIAGGGLFIGLATGGCAVCGLSFLAFLGLGGGAAFSHLEGYGFQLLTIFLLTISTIIIIQNS